MPTGDRVDPYKGFNFRIELDDTAVASFREVGGLNFNTDPVDYREGKDVFLHVRKLTGLRKFANITLKRGITMNHELWQWYLAVLNGEPGFRRNGAIVLQDEQHLDVMRWNFENGWICAWQGPTFNATSNEVAIEGIEICVERVELR